MFNPDRFYNCPNTPTVTYSGGGQIPALLNSKTQSDDVVMEVLLNQEGQCACAYMYATIASTACLSTDVSSEWPHPAPAMHPASALRRLGAFRRLGGHSEETPIDRHAVLAMVGTRCAANCHSSRLYQSG